MSARPYLYMRALFITCLLLPCLSPRSVSAQNALCAIDSGCACSESAPAAAPADSTLYKGTTYEFFNTPATWCDAESACRERGGNLVSLLTAAENDIAVELCNRNLPDTTEQVVPLPNQACWIGLNDRDLADQPANTNERNFKWSDGSAVNKAFINSMWHSGRWSQPDDKGQDKPEDCIFLYKPLPGWHDRDCAGQHMFICKVLSEEARKERNNSREISNQTAAGAATATVSAGNSNSINVSPPAASPAPSGGLSAKEIATIAGPTISGVAGVIVAAYTGWKWYHKRKQTLVKLKTGTTSDSFAVRSERSSTAGGSNLGSSKSVDAAV